MTQLRIRRLGYALGAEVRGLDLRETLDDAVVAELRAAWLEHHVLCFPDQKLPHKDQFVAFAARFGEVDRVGAGKHRDPDHPDIVLISNKPIDGKPWDGHKQGQTWHSDQSFTVRPNPATFLLSKEVPDVGGDTLFANQTMAYDTLSPKLREIILGLDAVHDPGKNDELERQRDIARAKDPQAVAKPKRERNDPPVVHPVVEVHPETGRRSLYLGDRVRNFVGMTEEESAPLLRFLLAHATSYELTYRHRWHADDLIMWDNRCLMHLALSDYDLYGDPRHMWRCSLKGPVRGALYDPQTQTAVAAVS